MLLFTLFLVCLIEKCLGVVLPSAVVSLRERAEPAPTAVGFRLQDVYDAPMYTDVGPLSAFSAVNIEGHTRYLSMIGGSITWTAQDSSRIEKTVTVTSSGQTTQVTQAAGVIIAVAEGGSGDLSALIAPEVYQELQALAETVCALAKRQPQPPVAVAPPAECRNVFEAYPDEARAQLNARIRNALARFMENAEGTAQGGAIVAAEITEEQALGGIILLAGVLTAAYAGYLTNGGPAPSNNVIVLPNGQVQSAWKSSSGDSCPKGTELPECEDNNCKGQASQFCTEGKLLHCPCKPVLPLFFDANGWTRQTWQEQMAAFQYIFELEFSSTIQPTGPKPILPENALQCDNSYHYSVEFNLFRRFTNIFCQEYASPDTRDIAVSVRRDYSIRDIDWEYWAGDILHGYEGWTFEFEWEDKPGVCNMPCVDIYNAFSRCTWNSHSMEVSGTITQDCGIASYHLWDRPKALDQGVRNCRDTGPYFHRKDGIMVAQELCADAVDGNWKFQPKAAKSSPSDFSGTRLYKWDDYYIRPEIQTVNSTGDTVYLDDQTIIVQMTADLKYCPSQSYSVSFGAKGADYNKEQCVAQFQSVLDNCNTENGTYKYPASTYKNCIWWQIGLTGK